MTLPLHPAQSDLADKALAPKIDRTWRDALFSRAVLLQAIAHINQAAFHKASASTDLGVSIARLDAALNTLTANAQNLKRGNNAKIATRAGELEVHVLEEKRRAVKENL